MKTRILHICVSILVVSTLLQLVSPVIAAKRRRRKTTNSSSQATYTHASYTQAKLNRLTNSVTLTFINVNNTINSTYTLEYKSNGVSQGIVGTITPNGEETVVRDLYFGTCSHGVCTAHYNITNASLTVVTTLVSGGVYRKKYVIRI